MKYCNFCMAEIDDSADVCPVCSKSTEYELPVHHLAPGTLLSNKYYVGASLGEGGFGITYIGMDTKLEMKVAIKEYYPNGYASRANTAGMSVSCGTNESRKDFFEKGKERFLREARVLAKFSGEPGVVDVRDFFEENNTAYIVMEYLDGETLKSYLKRNGTMAPDKAVEMLMPVMLSLKKVHDQGLIHRDISPDNIMLVGKQVKLLDFGAARNVSGVANKSLSVMLKPGYAPEEQYRSKGDQGPWTDIYALCATIYKCVTGVTPDDSTQRVFSDEVKTPSAMGVKISPVTEHAIMKGLSVLKRDRYQNIDELLNGFKGVEKVEDDDERTVYGGMVVDDDAETTFIDESSATVLADDDVTVSAEPVDAAPAPARPAPKKESKKNKQSKTGGKPAAKAESKPAEAPKAQPSPEAAQPQQPKKKKKLPIIIGSAAAALVALVVVIIILASPKSGGNSSLNNGSQVNSSSVKVSSSAEYDDSFKELKFSDATLTAEDMAKISEYPDIRRLTFTNCVIDDETFAQITSAPETLSYLTLYKCSGITDYSPIGSLANLSNLTINHCGLTDDQFAAIDFSGVSSLYQINLSDNEELTSIASLEGCSGLAYAYLNRCALKSLSGLETAIELKIIQAADNQLTDINGLTNCTVLREVNLNNNKISDISLLSKSAAELQYVYLNNNSVSDISALKGTGKLTYFSIDNNKVGSISPLAQSTLLVSISAAGNELKDLNGIKDLENLKYFFFANNKLTDISALKTRLAAAKNSVSMIDLRNNQLTALELTCTNSVYTLAIYGNQLTSLDGVSSLEGSTILFNYIEGQDYSALKDGFSSKKVLDCPLDKQVATKDTLGWGTAFVTADEADQLMAEDFAANSSITGDVSEKVEE